MKKLLNLFDYFFVLRPVLFFPVWALFLAGHYGYGEAASTSRPIGANGVAANGSFHELVWVGLALTLLMGGVFVIQQVMERKSDDGDRALPLIAPDHLTPKVAFIEAAILALVAIAVSFVFSWKVGLIFCVLLILTGILHSFSPFSLKDKPVASVFLAALAALLIFAAGWLLEGSLSTPLLVHSIPYICISVAAYLIGTLPDERKGEKKAVAFGAEFGVRTTVYTALFFDIVAIVVAYLLRDELIFYPAFFSLPFFVWAAISLNMHDVVRAMKYPIFIFALTVCFKWEIAYGNYALFFVIAGLYVVSKIYYRLQFGVNYPSL